MKKIISYRQKLIELAKIYKLEKVLDKKKKLTTYDIELILLKNSVPIPSRKSYLHIKLTNEILKPLLNSRNNFSLTLASITKVLIKTPDYIVNYFSFVGNSINSLFKFISRSIINFLNDIYNFKVKEDLLNKIISRAGYVSLIIILGFSAFYIKEFITQTGSVKISFEFKSDNSKNTKNYDQEVVKKSKLKKDEEKENKIAKKSTNSNQPKNKPSKVLKPESSQEKSQKIVKVPKEENKLKQEDENNYDLNYLTVLNLFEDLDYNLSKVRNEKKVKPIYFTRLPKDINSIKSITTKKELFLQIVLPLVVTENEKINRDREYLLRILKKTKSEKEKKWLDKKFKEYKVSSKKISELISRIDIIPTSIALAQAAKESGWGTSRFALEGNAIFGQWTWNGKGIEPLEKTGDQKHKILKFPILRASVKAYISNLNTHNGYKSFRLKRSELRKKNKKLRGLDLIHELDKYAQTGKQYTIIIEQIIRQNSLDDFEATKILDNKDKKQLNL